MTLYKEIHNPRNDTCEHNDNPDSACTCKAIRTRKPYRVCRVTDRSASHGIKPQLILEVHPEGLLVIRESGRRMRVETTLAIVYERALMQIALVARREKKKLRRENRIKRKI